MNSKPNRLLTDNITKLLVNQSVPAIVGMMVIAAYNIADTIFVGQGVGTNAIAGISIVLPIQMLISSIAMAIGIGGASIISRSIGAKQLEKAKQTFGNMANLSIHSGILSFAVVQFFASNILALFNSDIAVEREAIEYLSIISYGFPFIGFLMISGSAIRAEGHAKMSMNIMIISALINFALDPVFIFGFKLGVFGAGLATVISQISTLFYFIFFLRSDKTIFHLHFENFKLRWLLVKEIASIGVSSFARQAIGSVVIGMINSLLLLYGSTISVAAYGIQSRIIMFGIMPILGLNQGMMTLVGQNYGAKKITRVLDSFKQANVAGIGFGILFFIVVLLFPQSIVSVFTSDQDLIVEGAKIVQYVMLAFPLIPYQIMISGYYQATGNAKMSFFFAIFRQILLLGPLVAILPQFFGENGIWFAFPISDFVAGVVSLIIIIKGIDKLKRMEISN